MEKYHFVKKINGTDETGIMDIESQKLICLCTEENSELLLKALRQPPVSGALPPAQSLENCDELGDTFIDFRTLSPKMQWRRIDKMLTENGMDVIRRQ